MKPDVKKIIADIKATKGNRKFCNGLAGTLQDDNYASSICKYVKTVTPERIDLLIEYAEKLEAEVTDMAVQLANAESKCRELAAENEKRNTHSEALAADNAALREVVERMVNQFAMSGISPEEKSINPAKSLMFDAKSALFMPATDAFLAEVRAQVWIEGSEPEEFGRYWVRYETDVGPQYCSAKWMEHNFCAGSNTNIHKIWLADHSRSINSLRGVTHYTKLPDSLEGAAQ
ncbi:hypothetical protein [Citrobacter freundii]|uniref:hypothetical protein n=1 Tax=Citrobacter freundii TaxID=546 RepID=UPI00159389DB|nr:hypothetical protein [Citrobacter freundii]MCY3449679.1 hypothetical protein [Citrobacter freundii]QKX81572.1 hypothetical protein GTH18_10025 [Citrobacter freundii]